MWSEPNLIEDKTDERGTLKELNIEDVRSICDEILGRYHVTFSDYQEERKDGEVKFVHLTLKFKVSNCELRKNTSCSPDYADSKKWWHSVAGEFGLNALLQLVQNKDEEEPDLLAMICQMK